MSVSFVRKNLFVAVLILLLALAGWFLFTNVGQGDAENESDRIILYDDSVNSTASILGDGYLKFTHPTLSFSIEYPEDLELKAFDEGDSGETVVFQNKAVTESERKGFQIFVIPFDDGSDISVLSKERILKDQPFAVVDEPLEVIIGDNIRALLFWGEDPSVGRTREVWFVHEGYLYEVTTYARLDEWLAGIMTSWRFE